MDSDHNALLMNIELNSKINLKNLKATPCYALTDWDKYQSIMLRELSDINLDLESINQTSQIDNLINQLP
jgi:hypothetical protein